jgi:hypothetical protein
MHEGEIGSRFDSAKAAKVKAKAMRVRMIFI